MDENYFNELHIALRKIIQAVDIHSKKLYKTYGLTGPQMLLLMIIMDEEGSTISRIAKKASLSQATVTDIIVRLEKYGFLTRQVGASDKRSKIITLTEKATDILKQEPRLFDRSFIEGFSSLEDWEKSFLLAAIQKMSYLLKTEKINQKQEAEAILNNPV